MICMRLFLPFILAVSLLSGCGLSDDTREQLEIAIGKVAGEAWDSTKTKTARAAEKLSKKLEESDNAQELYERIVKYVDDLFEESNNGKDCKKKSAQKPKPQQTGPKTLVKRSSAQQNYHDEVLSLTTLKAASVNIDCLRPELDTAINVIVAAYHEVFEDDNYRPIITSGNDSDKHGERSAHYACAAVDIRIKDVEDIEIRKALAKAITEDLDTRYVVLHEDVGRANEHLHIQLKSGTYNRNEVWQ
ncbi:MAG: hypothetical protein II819_09095 [Fibrobacter sp.]|nr:hypothetical protein [Fibrobacter sp.]